MEQRELEVTVRSARGLKNVRPSGMMTLYAVVWVYSNMKVPTPIDPTGSVNPTWNALLKLIVEQSILEQPFATLNIDIYDYGSISNEHVGSCSVPLSHFQEMDRTGARRKKVIWLPVRTPSGGPEGRLYLSLKLGDLNQPPSMPGPSSAVAHPVEPNNNNGMPAYSVGYSNGSNQAGGSQYLQYHSQHRQPHTPVVWQPLLYHPPAGQYAGPPPRRRTGLFGGGFGTGLLGGALGGLGSIEGFVSGARQGLLFGQALLGGFGGGLGDGGFGGSGFGGGLGDSGFAGGGFGGSGCGGGGWGA